MLDGKRPVNRDGYVVRLLKVTFSITMPCRKWQRSSKLRYKSLSGRSLHHLLIIPNDLDLLSIMNDKNVVAVQLTAVDRDYLTFN